MMYDKMRGYNRATKRECRGEGEDWDGERGMGRGG